MDTMESGFLFKVVLIGEPAVGKTSLVHRYINNSFSSTYKTTMGVDFSLKRVQWSENCVIKLQLWDIAGHESFTSMTHIYYRNAAACLVMFDVTRRDTFEKTVNWKNDLDTKYALPDGSSVPCLLLANKCDCIDEREVSSEEIEELSRENDFLGWSEMSVKQGAMVNECMRFLIEEMLAKSQQMDAPADPEFKSPPCERVKLGKETSKKTTIKCSSC